MNYLLYIHFCTGDICPPEFDYRFGTCSKTYQEDDTNGQEEVCKEDTMGTGKASILPHVSMFNGNDAIYLQDNFIIA
jgi:hypothetical protein